VHAVAALRREERDDVIADRKACDPVAKSLDDPRPLMSEHRRRVAGGINPDALYMSV